MLPNNKLESFHVVVVFCPDIQITSLFPPLLKSREIMDTPKNILT